MSIFAQAVAAHKKGDFATAERGYRAVLSANADEFEAHYLLGAVLVQSEQFDKAIDPLSTYLDRNPTHAAALNALGAALSKTGEAEQAVQVLKRAVAINPNDAKTLMNLGRAALEGGKYEDGAPAFESTLQLNPNYVDALVGYATCIAELNDQDKAVELLEKCADDGNSTAQVYEILLKLLLKDEQFETALLRVKQGRALWPDNNALVLAEATARRNIDPKSNAREVYEELLKRDPDNPSYLNKFGDYLYEMGHWKEAEHHVRRAVELDPKSIGAINNLGRIRQQRGDLDGARRLYKRSVHELPDYADAHNNLANLYLNTDQVDDAIASYNRAIDLKPDSQDFIFNRSTALMTRGQIKAHLEDHQMRFEKRKPEKSRDWGWPRWSGQSLEGRRILLWGEQGIGDEVIHARCASQIASLAQSCTLECSERLTRLFERSFPDIDICAHKKPPDQKLTEGPFDFQSSTLNMTCWPHEDATSIPSQAYLKADPDKTRTLRSQYQKTSEGRPLVGISWRGGGSHYAHFKSVPLESWKNILANPDVTFVDLQYGDCRSEVSAVENEHGAKILKDPDVNPLGDLDLYASQVAAMDLVITISNAAAHMAGALGVPVWNMIPTGPARLWYWFIEGSASPWYDSMRLFRHAHNEGWDNVLKDIEDLLGQTVPSLGSPTHLPY